MVLEVIGGKLEEDIFKFDSETLPNNRNKDKALLILKNHVEIFHLYYELN